MSIDYAQFYWQPGGASALAHTVAMTLAVTTGHSVVVEISSRNPVASVTDNKGNAYARDAAATMPGASASVWRSSNVVGGSNFILTVTLASPSTCDVFAHEITAILTPFQTLTRTGIVPQGGVTITPGVGSAPGFHTIGFGVLSMNMATQHVHAPPSGWPHVRTNYDEQESTDIVTGVFLNTNYQPSWFCEVAGSVFGTVLQTYYEGVSANFTGTPTSGASPLLVVFTDASTGSPTSWFWQFGDGQLSVEQHPTVNYTVPGVYSVTLTVRRGGVPDSTLFRQNYIVVDGAPEPPPPDPPTQPGIPDVPPPNPFSPTGPLARVPGTVAFLLANAPPPVIVAPSAPSAEIGQPVLMPVVSGAGSASRFERAGRALSLVVNSLVNQGYLPRTGDDGFGVIAGGFAFDRPPTADDDASIGAQVGSWYVDNADENGPAVYVCLSADVGAAVWAEVLTEYSDLGSSGLTGDFP